MGGSHAPKTQKAPHSGPCRNFGGRARIRTVDPTIKRNQPGLETPEIRERWFPIGDSQWPEKTGTYGELETAYLPRALYPFGADRIRLRSRPPHFWQRSRLISGLGLPIATKSRPRRSARATRSSSAECRHPALLQWALRRYPSSIMAPIVLMLFIQGRNTGIAGRSNDRRGDCLQERHGTSSVSTASKWRWQWPSDPIGEAISSCRW